jgi:acyl carrier protein
VAYVVLSDAATTGASLRAFLAEKLPPHLLPAAFVPLAALPTTPHGKVDVKALPAPDQERTAVAATYAPPRSETERRIAAVWQQVLKVAEVGVHDNFFELGGNSLLLAQVHRALRQELGIDIALVDLFKFSTVSALAGYTTGDPREPGAAQQRLKDEGLKRRAAIGARRDAAQARQRRIAR